MIFEILESNDPIQTKLFLLICTPAVVLFSLSIHEYFHGIASYAMGDPTAKRRGRLTLNPIKHLNPLGTLCMVMFGFGWARPVPVDPRYYKDPKHGMALCGLAGPLINAVIGVTGFAAFWTVYSLVARSWVFEAIPFAQSIPEWVIVSVANLFYMLGYYNIMLAVFNLIPVPPLDGSRVLFAVLPERTYFSIMKYERIIMFVMLALLWRGIFDPFFDAVLTAAMNAAESVVCGFWDGFFRLFAVNALFAFAR